MLVKMIMRDATGVYVAGVPTVTADGEVLTPVLTAELTDQYEVDAPVGTLVRWSLIGAIPVDVQMPATDATAIITDGVTITPSTLGTDGLALGRVMPYGKIITYLNNVAQDEFNADADGDYSFQLPTGSLWTLVASNPPHYKTTSTQVSTIVV